MKRVIALMLMSLFLTGTLSACNTMRGAGQDVKKAGDKIEQKAEEKGADGH